MKEQEQVPITVQSEDEEKSLSDEVRVHTEQKIQKQSEEEAMSRGIKGKFLQIASIKHQGKALSMLGEIGTAWRPKTRPENKL